MSPPIGVHNTHDPSQTQALAAELAKDLAVGDCLALIGDLGAGKTVFVRGLAKGLSLPEGLPVSSPTFVLCNEYPTTPRLYHLDLYRMTDAPAELGDLGLDEMLADGIVVVEWAERGMAALPAGTRRIRITHTGPNDRRLEIEG